MKKIAVEEHYGSEEHFYMRSRWLEANGFEVSPPMNVLVKIGEKQCDIAKYRLDDMDKNDIEMQLLMLALVGIERLDNVQDGIYHAKKANDYLAETIQRWPDRFSGIATLPLQSPEASVRELERCVKELGIPSACIGGYVQGSFIDDPKYDCLWETADHLGTVLSLHPTDAPAEHLALYAGHNELKASTWNWGVDAATYTLRILFSGIFDRFPNTQLLIGHMGEMLPYFMWRIENRWKVTPCGIDLKLSPCAYFKKNIYISTSGVFYEPALQCAIDFMGADRILFAVDYPFESNEIASRFIDNAAIGESARQAICYGNAERIFGLKNV